MVLSQIQYFIIVVVALIIIITGLVFVDIYFSSHWTFIWVKLFRFIFHIHTRSIANDAEFECHQLLAISFNDIPQYWQFEILWKCAHFHL